MSSELNTHELTTLICLFHHHDRAQSAVEDLLQAGVPESSVTMIGGAGSESTNSQSELTAIGVPAGDLQHLSEGIAGGGAIVSVRAISDHIDTVEGIFHKHSAVKIDEVDGDEKDGRYAAATAPLAAAAAMPRTGATQTTGEMAIPIVEEEMVVGKRNVDLGGVRVFKRVVEIPVEESVSLREEHVVVERRAVDRAVTDADFAQGNRTIELTETAEEAVVGKTARVVEEVLVGKEVGQRTETIHDTVRKTEVEVEEIPSTETNTGIKNDRY